MGLGPHPHRTLFPANHGDRLGAVVHGVHSPSSSLSRHRAVPITMSSEANASEDKILTQLNFYFGDSNFRRDRFLRSTAEKDDGCE